MVTHIQQFHPISFVFLHDHCIQSTIRRNEQELASQNVRISAQIIINNMILI